MSYLSLRIKDALLYTPYIWILVLAPTIYHYRNSRGLADPHGGGNCVEWQRAFAESAPNRIQSAVVQNIGAWGILRID